jgi:hypothetical protein
MIDVRSTIASREGDACGIMTTNGEPKWRRRREYDQQRGASIGMTLPNDPDIWLLQP